MCAQAPPVVPEAAHAALREAGIEPASARVARLSGGMIATTMRVVGSGGFSAILKSGLRGDLWRIEAEGLELLRAAPGPEVPRVYAAGDSFLLIEDFPGAVPDDGDYWDALAERLAALHGVHAERFGAAGDNVLGRLAQRNAPAEDGWEFFAEHRLLRFLDEPLCVSTLDGDDRAGIERIAGRLRDIVPAQPASLVHGDLWRMNLVATRDGAPGYVDPAPYHAWAEIDLSMLWCCGGVPMRFIKAYQAVRPLQSGWAERFEVLHLRELLSTVAHFGAHGPTLERIRATIRRFG